MDMRGAKYMRKIPRFRAAAFSTQASVADASTQIYFLCIVLGERCDRIKPEVQRLKSIYFQSRLVQSTR